MKLLVFLSVLCLSASLISALPAAVETSNLDKHNSEAPAAESPDGSDGAEHPRTRRWGMWGMPMYGMGMYRPWGMGMYRPWGMGYGGYGYGWGK